MPLVLKTLDFRPVRNFLVLRGQGEVLERVPQKSKVPLRLQYESGIHIQNATFQLSEYGQSSDNKDYRNFKLTIPIDEALLPLISISLDLPSWLSVTGEITEFTAAIFPRSAKEFETHFIRRAQRFGNRNVQFFVSRQISKSFSGLRAYRVAAAVVMAYKAIEINNHVLESEALEEVCSHLLYIDECTVEAHPRRNREHLITSLLLVKWHLELTLGRYSDFITTLEVCREYARTPLASFFTPAYNLSLSLLMRCIVARLDGDTATSKSVSDECLELYKKAVRDADRRTVLFKELEVSHAATHRCLEISAATTDFEEDYKSWIRQAIRVRSDSATGLVQRVLGKGA